MGDNPLTRGVVAFLLPHRSGFMMWLARIAAKSRTTALCRLLGIAFYRSLSAALRANPARCPPDQLHRSCWQLCALGAFADGCSATHNIPRDTLCGDVALG